MSRRFFAAQYVLLACFLILPAISLAQVTEPEFNWSLGLGGTDEESLGAVAFDNFDNSIVFGMYYDEIDVGTGPLAAAGERDLFIAKYDTEGESFWSKTLGGVERETAGELIVLSDNSFVISGSFGGTVDFGGGGLTATGTNDAFLARYNSEGVFMWSVVIGGAGTQYATDMTTDINDNLFVGGSFFDEINFGIGSLVSAGASDVFVAKYSADGIYNWARSFGSTVGESDIQIAVDSSDHLLIAGDFTTTLNFGGLDLVNTSENSFYLARLAGADGTHHWSHSFSSSIASGGLSINDIDTDLTNNVVCIGEFTGAIDFGGGGSYNNTEIYPDMFMVRISTIGDHSWSKVFSSSGIETPMDIEVDWAGNLQVVGYHYMGGDLDFGNGNLPNLGQSDVFLAAFEDDGSDIWSGVFGGLDSETGNSVAVGFNGRILLGGTFSGSPDFGGGALSYSGDEDVFLLNIGSPWCPCNLEEIPEGIALDLLQNVPNPFNPITTISFNIIRTSRVNLRIYDIAGRLVRTLLTAETVEPGQRQVKWNGRNDSGSTVASGVYIYRLDSSGYSETRRLTFIK